MDRRVQARMSDEARAAEAVFLGRGSQTSHRHDTDWSLSSHEEADS